MNDLEVKNNTTFESIKHIDEDGMEFWYINVNMKCHKNFNIKMS